MIPVVVPDASVLLKWALDTTDEEDRQQALQLREDWLADRCRIVVPSLWVYEVGNVLGRREAQLAPRLLAILVEYRFEEMDTLAPVGWAKCVAPCDTNGFERFWRIQRC